MNEHDLLVKLIEQNTESTNEKIDSISTKIDTLENKNIKAHIEHKVHDKLVEDIKMSIIDHIKQDGVVQKDIDDKLSSIDKTMAINTLSLQEHMDNNRILRQLTEDNKTFIRDLHEETQLKITEAKEDYKLLHKNNESRIDKLEEPAKAKAYLKKAIMGIGIVAGSIAAVLKLIDTFS